MKKETEIAVAKGLPTSVQLKAMLTEETNRQKVLDAFIKENLRDNIDFGVIPGTSRPTLLKPGAEKVIGLFNIRAEFSRDTETLEMLGLQGAVAFKCTLVDRRNGEVVGEGRGVAMPKEKTSWTPNTQVKICEKRAMVDAVLQTFGLSSRYTQDVEDMNGNQPQKGYPVQSGLKMASQKQVEFIDKLIRELNGKLKKESLEKQLGKNIDRLTMVEAKKVIDQLINLKGAKNGEPTIDADTGEVIEGEIIDDEISIDDLPK